MSGPLHHLRFARDHRWAPQHMSDYLDGELESSRAVRIERHVGECQECRTVLMGLRNMLDALRRLPLPSGGRDAVQVAAAVRLQVGETQRPS